MENAICLLLILVSLPFIIITIYIFNKYAINPPVIGPDKYNMVVIEYKYDIYIANNPVSINNC